MSRDDELKKEIAQLKEKLDGPVVYLDQTALELGLAEMTKTCKWLIEKIERAISSREHTEYWYMTRWERLKQYAKEKGFHHDVCAIMANGALDHEPPTYAQMYNILAGKLQAADRKKYELQEIIWGLEQKVNDLEEELNGKKVST